MRYQYPGSWYTATNRRHPISHTSHDNAAVVEQPLTTTTGATAFIGQLSKNPHQAHPNTHKLLPQQNAAQVVMETFLIPANKLSTNPVPLHSSKAPVESASMPHQPPLIPPGRSSCPGSPTHPPTCVGRHPNAPEILPSTSAPWQIPRRATR